jgi:uncharacterized membrane protein
VLAVSTFWIVFRFIHIVSGILWVGAAFALTVFVEPTVDAMGPEGGKFMTTMADKRKVGQVITVLATLTVFAGLVLYWKLSSGLDTAWMKTAPGVGFTIGTIAAIAAYVLGGAVVGPTVAKMTALGKQIGASGGPPQPEQAQNMKALVDRFRTVSRTSLVLVLIAASAMATARYW